MKIDTKGCKIEKGFNYQEEVRTVVRKLGGVVSPLSTLGSRDY